MLDTRLLRNLRRAGITPPLRLTYLNSDLLGRAGLCACCVASKDVCPPFTPRCPLAICTRWCYTAEQ